MAADERNDLQRVVDELCEVYNVQGACIWLLSDQRWSPTLPTYNALRMISDGHAEVVLQRIEQLATGAVL